MVGLARLLIVGSGMIAPKPSKRYAPGAPLTRAVHGVTNGVNGWPTFGLAQLSRAAWVLGGDELLGGHGERCEGLEDRVVGLDRSPQVGEGDQFIAAQHPR